MIQISTGDITHANTDLIVNAANSQLIGGGGVDGAIHRAAGPSIYEEGQDYIRRFGRLSAGSAMYTSAGKLPFKAIIHTVGPVWRGGNNNEDQLLADCYTSSIKLSLELGGSSLAFPNISTGVYGFPKMRAAEIAISTVRELISTHSLSLNVNFVCYDAENYSLYQRLL